MATGNCGLSDRKASHKAFGHGEHALDNHPHACRIGVNHVGEIEFRVTGDAIEKERIERHAMFLCEARIDRVKRLGIGFAIVARRQHAREQDRNVARLQPRDDLIERILGDLGIKPAQGVIRAKLDNHAIRAIGDGPIEALEASGGGIPRDTGILDRDIETLRAQRLFENTRESIRPRQQVACRQAVSECHEAEGPRL